MTLTVTFSPWSPLLSLVLAVASIAMCARSTCLLAAFLAVRREGMFPRLLRWQGASLGVAALFLASGGAWQPAAVLGVLAAGALRMAAGEHG